MEYTFETGAWGRVTAKYVMIDGEFNNLEEGIEFTGESIHDKFTTFEDLDLDSLSVDDVENIIEENI